MPRPLYWRPPDWEEAPALPDIPVPPVEATAGNAGAPLIAALEYGWAMLPHAVIGGPGEAPVTIDIVLLHPARGVALLEAPPHWTPDAPARLQRRLTQARFAAIFPGTLPVVHARLERGAVAGLPQLLAREFAAQPPLDLPGGNAWVAVVRRALLAPAETAAPARDGRRRGGLIGATGLVLAGALGGGFLAARPTAAPKPEAAAQSGILERLASSVVVSAEASSALPPTEGLSAPPLPEAALPVPAAALTEDARAIEFAEAPSLTVPSLPPSPPAMAAPPAPEPHATLQPAFLRDAAARLAHPAPGDAPSPPAAPVAASSASPAAAGRPQADPSAVVALLRRGDTLLALGDVSGARRFYERAAEAGSAAGARAAGRTHDPALLAELGVRGIRPDPEAAAAWYRRGAALAAQERP
ncbi:hypothetical protein E2C06_10070 [Dankookia rubra]|uniref:Sel1 repeat family protein n=1 Tax=Dankookia rubra TaxID=1442381 RepID=A0A4R5QHE9_9PROT|nr:hypothetical protein [Dankookia rubra]TDH62740.1 hypothetical protein E2C06_10070 [Dankookia rubra]